MPELPEVETVVRTITPYLLGRRMRSASFSSPLVVRQDFDWLAQTLAGQKIHAIERRAKFILLRLDRGTLVVHLGMTGKLLAGARPGPYTRARFLLDRGTLLYDDIRQFGRIEWSGSLPARVASLGPEPLAVELDELRSMLRTRRSRIKPLLLSQKFLGGIGNIYADEMLFAARIHPLANASQLGSRRVKSLHGAMRDVLSRAIERGGSSVSDYVDAEGRRGWFQIEHQVYGRAGLSCFRCGASIRRIVVAQRGTHFCPRCQRR